MLSVTVLRRLVAVNAKSGDRFARGRSARLPQAAVLLMATVGLAAVPAVAQPAAPVEPPGSTTAITGSGWAFTNPDLAVTTGGDLLAVWLAFDGNDDLVLAATHRGSEWSVPEVLAGPGILTAPRVAAGADGVACVAWTGRTDGGYDVFVRRRTIGGHWGPAEQITAHAGPDTHAVAVYTPEGRLWVVWESFRDGRFDLYARCLAGGTWGAELRVTDHPASDVLPTIACDPSGVPWVAWMSWRDGRYGEGNYEIYACRLVNDAAGPPVRVSTSPHTDAFPRLVPLPGGLALAWSEGWLNSKTQGILPVATYDRWEDRVAQVAWLQDGTWGTPVTVRLPVGDRASGTPGDELCAVAGPNPPTVWLVLNRLLKFDLLRADWRTHIAVVTPEGQRGLIDISDGRGVTGRGFGVAWQDQALWLAEGMDARQMPSDVRFMPPPVQARSLPEDPARPRSANWVRVRRLDPDALSVKPLTSSAPARPRTSTAAGLSPAPMAREPRPVVEHAGQSWSAWYGNLHFHSDLSRDGRGFDGAPWLNLQAAYDIGRLDFAGLTDHAEMITSGDWWSQRRLADLWDRPGDFVALPAYEWSSSKYGHKNVIFPDAQSADQAALTDALEGRSPNVLWQTLGTRRAVTIPHHTSHGLAQPTDWSFHDPRFQRLVEIFQVRGNYEYDGAPLQDPPQVPATYYRGRSVRDALDRGYRLGIIASPDHSGGLGLAGVWAPRLDREAIFDALWNRRCFGTTGVKMSLYLEVNGVPLGGEAPAPGGRPVTLHARVRGTVPGLTLTIVRDGVEIHTVQASEQETVLDWSDPPGRTAPRYYYLRAVQSDGHIGWTSPVWLGSD